MLSIVTVKVVHCRQTIGQKLLGSTVVRLFDYRLMPQYNGTIIQTLIPWVH